MEQQFALFHTPLSVYDVAGVEEMNGELRERLSEEARTASGMRRSNAGGWHSPADLALRTDACYRAVMKLIVDHVGATQSKVLAAMGLSPTPWRAAAEAWAMVMHNGDYTIVHEHGDAHWSATYYVDAGDADPERTPDSGALAVLDPRRGGRPIAGIEPGSTFTIRPRTGMLVVFPGWLQHYVHPYRGTRARISIACNLTLSPAGREAAGGVLAPMTRAAGGPIW